MVVGVVFWEKLDLWEGCFGVIVFFHFSWVDTINPSDKGIVWLNIL